MDLSERIAEQVAKIPTTLKPLFEKELAAGNPPLDVEIGRGEDLGKVALVFKRPFHSPPSSAPPGVKYRESERKFGRVLEFVTDDDSFSLLTVKFKKIVLQQITGPTNPKDEHTAHSKQREKDQVARLASHKKQSEAEIEADPILVEFRKVHADCSPAAKKFLMSMKVTFDMWHDGEGYDLDALDDIPKSECETIEKLLINHNPRDWRDIEALALFDSPAARSAIKAALKHCDPKVRREAMKHTPEGISSKKRETLLINALKTKGLYTGLSEALDEVEEFHPPKVIDALFRGSLDRDGEAAVHFVAMLYFLHGKSKEPFDWSHRPFFLKFHTSDPVERKALFRKLCATLGVDVKKYLRS